MREKPLRKYEFQPVRQVFAKKEEFVTKDQPRKLRISLLTLETIPEDQPIPSKKHLSPEQPMVLPVPVQPHQHEYVGHGNEHNDNLHEVIQEVLEDIELLLENVDVAAAGAGGDGGNGGGGNNGHANGVDLDDPFVFHIEFL